MYSVPIDINNIELQWSCNFPTDKSSKVEREESLFTVTWCYDTYEAENDRNPFKVVTGGTLGHIYVIDYVSRKLSNVNNQKLLK